MTDSIHCHNRGAGCTWKGTYEELGTHLKGGCSARFERCTQCGHPKSTASSNQTDSSCQCSAQANRILCPFCPEQLNRSEVTSHIQKCRLVKQACVECGVQVERAQLRDHKIEECGAAFVPCPFSAPSFHRKQLRKAAKLNERLVSGGNQGVQISSSDNEDDESEEDEEDEYQLGGLQGCEHDLLRRDEVRSHITQQAEAHLAFAVAALKAHRNCLESTRLDLEDEREARQRFQTRAKSLESRVQDLEDELSFVKARLEKYVARYGDEIADEQGSATDDDEIEDIDLDGDEKTVQEEMSRVASLIWSTNEKGLASDSASASQHPESHSDTKTPEEARRQLLASLPPGKRMLANLLIQAQRQQVQSVVCAPNAHDDVSRKDRQGRRFYSRSELLSLRRSVMDSLAKRDTYPDVGASIYIDVQDNRSVAQSASTSTLEGAAVAAMARLRNKRQEKIIQRQKEQPSRRAQTTIIMGAALNGGAGIGKGLKPGSDGTPLVKTWQKRGANHASGGGGGRRGAQQETPIDTRNPITTDHLGNKLSQDKLNAGLTKASKPWVPRALKSSSSNPEVVIQEKKEGSSSTDLNPAMIFAGEEAARILRGMLNKVTAANIQNFSTKLWASALGGLTRVEQVESSIETLFEKAVAESGFTAAYAQLVKALVRHPEAHAFDQYVQSGEATTKVQRTLHWVLISRCRREFEAAFKTQMDLVHSLGQNGDGQSVLSEEDDIKAEATKKRLIGVLRFLGELYKNEQLLDVIMFACVDRLLDVVLALIPRNETQIVTKAHQAKIEILIDEITTLLHNILPNMVFATSSRSPLPAAKRDELRPVLNAQKSRLISLADNPVLTKRAKILLLNLFEK